MGSKRLVALNAGTRQSFRNSAHVWRLSIGQIGAREIARAFNLKNDRRVELKRMLRELADEGRVEAKRKKLHHPGALPQVTLADITGRDNDGELIATPTEWDEDAHGAVPKIRITSPR